MTSRFKLAAPFVVAAALLVLSGCGSQKSADNAPSNSQVGKSSPEKTSDSTSQANLPKPTGKVDDAVNAVMEDANNEQATSDSLDNEAKTAAGDSNETTDLGNTYNENEL